MRKAIDWLSYRAEGIVFDSLSTKSDFMNHFPHYQGVGEVVYPGTPSDCRDSSEDVDASLLDEFDLPDNYFLYLGGNHPRKGAKMMLEIFSSIALKTDHTLVMVGPDFGIDPTWTNSPIIKQVGQKIRTLGLVSRAQLLALFRRATALAFPSRYEGFGFPVLEAMACKCPVVCFRTSSLPEVAGSAALTIEPFDCHEFARALLRLADSKQLCHSLVCKGLERIQEFRWEITAHKVLELMRRVATSSLEQKRSI